MPRRSQWYFIVLGLVVALGPSAPAWASLPEANPDACESPLVQISDWNALPPSTELPLKSAFLAELMQHPTTRKLHARYLDGRSLRFELIHLPALGWKMQADFVRKVLHALLPRASFYPASARHSDRRRVTFRIIDTVSGMNDFGAGSLDMPLLKIANPGPALPDRNTIRHEMNLPVAARMVHLYDADGRDGLRNTVVQTLIDNNLADVILVSSREGFDHIGYSRYYPLGEEKPGPHPDYLDSSVRPKISMNQKPILYNSTRSRMHRLYAASDFAIVLGRGNSYEPAAEGRRVFVLVGGYELMDPRREEELQILVKSGYGQILTNLAELPDRIKNASSTANGRPPFSVADDEGRTALDLMLHSLRQGLDLHSR